MGRFATDSGGGDFTPAPVGTHRATCIRLIDLGTQVGEWQGKPLKRNQVVVMWELPDETIDTADGPRPFIVSKFYTNSLSEKATLRHDLVQWRGREFTPEELAKFDLQSILGKPCMLSVVHNDKGKAKVGAIMKLPKGMEAPAPHNEPWAFWLDEFSDSKFEQLSDWFKESIKKSPEYQALFTSRSQPSSGSSMDDLDDDIPFANPYRGRACYVV